MKLYKKIIIGMILGILIGVFFGKTGIFLGRDKLIIIPELGRKLYVEAKETSKTSAFPIDVSDLKIIKKEIVNGKEFYKVKLNAVAETPKRDGFVVKNKDIKIKGNWVVFDKASRNPYYYLTPSNASSSERISSIIKKVPILEVRALKKITWLKVRLPKGEGRDEQHGWLVKNDKLIPYSAFGNQLLQFLGILGQIFLLMIKMIVVPLIFCSLVIAVGGLGSGSQLGKLGGKALVYFMSTTVIAITIGLILANVIKPGNYMSDLDKTRLLLEFQSDIHQNVSVAKTTEPSIFNFVQGFVTQIIPSNVIKSAVDGKVLQVLFFAIIFGLAIGKVPKKIGKPILDFFNGANETLIAMVTMIMLFAPFGIFGLMAKIVGASGLGVLKTLLIYSLVVVAGLMIHAFGVYSMLVYFFAKISPFKFMRALRDAQLIALGTSSSSATYPITKKCVEKNLNVSEKISSFVLPLGTTVNMDGTALYQGVATLFVAQVFGMDLSFYQQLTIVITATLASVGAAGVPGAGLVILSMILITVGIPTEGIALILGVDRFLDMFRTVINVTGDSSCAVVIAATEGEKPFFSEPVEDVEDVEEVQAV